MTDFLTDAQIVSQIETLYIALVQRGVSTVELVELAENAERTAVQSGNDGLRPQSHRRVC